MSTVGSTKAQSLDAALCLTTGLCDFPTWLLFNIPFIDLPESSLESHQG